jgi:radical SAM protein with 4Fe4S-binding SPASM domain
MNDLLRRIWKALRALATRRVDIECDLIPFTFRKVPYRKILNWILVEASLYFKPEKPWGWPTHVQIEPITRCNLKCVFCPVTGGMERHRGEMDLGLFKRFIDEAGRHIFLILLWDWGEPFLHPDIYEMISYAGERGIQLVSSSNGHIFSRGDHAERVVRSGLDSLIFAVDGITQGTYERYRQDGNLDTVFEGIRRVMEKKRALDSPTPLVNLRFIAMRHNEHEIPELKKIAASLGVDALTVKKLNPHANDAYAGDRTEIKESELEFIPREARYRRFRYAEDGNTRFRAEANPCRQLWNNPVIHWDGKICSCTYDYNDKFCLGDLKESSFRDIWHGEAYRGMRRRFREGWEDLLLCRECSYAYEGGDCITGHMAEAHFFGEGREV